MDESKQMGLDTMAPPFEGREIGRIRVRQLKDLMKQADLCISNI